MNSIGIIGEIQQLAFNAARSFTVALNEEAARRLKGRGLNIEDVASRLQIIKHKGSGKCYLMLDGAEIIRWNENTLMYE
jgi:hypothetical protein